MLRLSHAINYCKKKVLSIGTSKVLAVAVQVKLIKDLLCVLITYFGVCLVLSKFFFATVGFNELKFFLYLHPEETVFCHLFLYRYPEYFVMISFGVVHQCIAFC